MTKREFASIILKLLGVYAIVESLPLLQFLGGVFFMRGHGDKMDIVEQGLMFVLMSLPFLLQAMVAIFLLVRSDTIAGWLIKGDNDFSLTGSLSGKEFQAICFAVAGVLIFLLGVPRFSQFIMNFWYLRQYTASQIAQDRFIASTWQSGITAAIQCGLAVILFFRAKGLAYFWYRIQTERYVKIEEAPSKE